MSRTISVFTPGGGETKTTTFPAPGRTSDASGARPYLAFDAATDEAVYYTAILPIGFTAPLTLILKYGMASATSGNTIWDGTVECVTGGDSLDLDTSESLDTANTSAADAVPATAGFEKDLSITLTNNDSAAAGDQIRVRIRRVGSSGSDTATGDALLFVAELRDAA